MLADDVMAAALIDHLVHHCHTVNIRGNSYRMKSHAELYRSLGAQRSTTSVQGSSAPTRSRRKEATAN